VITRRKSNISAASPQQYTTRQAYPDTHGEWVDAARRTLGAHRPGSCPAADPGSLRARVRAAAGQLATPPGRQVPGSGPRRAPGGAVRLMRRELPPGGTLGAPVLLGRSHANADAARVAAMRDAGPDADVEAGPVRPRGVRDQGADGTVVGYSIVPGAARA